MRGRGGAVWRLAPPAVLPPGLRCQWTRESRSPGDPTGGGGLVISMSVDSLVAPLATTSLAMASVGLWSLRVALAAKGRKAAGAVVAAAEAIVVALAFTHVASGLDAPERVAAYAVGVAVGTILGLAVDERLAGVVRAPSGRAGASTVSHSCAGAGGVFRNLAHGRGHGRPGDAALRRSRRQSPLRDRRNRPTRRPGGFVDRPPLGEGAGRRAAAPLFRRG